MEENTFEVAASLFKQSMNQIHPLPNEDVEKLVEILKYKKFNKGEVVLQEGKVCRHFWYIVKGCFRIFSLDNGLEVNVRFFFEGSLAADFISLRHEIPSQFYIVAMEDTEVLAAYKPQYKSIFTFSKAVVTLAAEFFANNFFKEFEHSNTFKLMTPEERYNNLVENRSEYLQRIPLTHLASYLGMSRKTLSRIRANTH